VIPLKDNVPSRGLPVVTIALVALTLLVFLWQLTLSENRASSLALARAGVSERDAATIEHGAVPYRLTHPGSRCGVTADAIVCGSEALEDAAEEPNAPPLARGLSAPAWWTTPFTSMFMHADLLGVLVSIVFLLVFGRTIEASLGRWRFALFYLVSGLVAIGIQTALDPNATGPIIGASGAIAGVLGAYVACYSRAKVVGIVLLPLFGTLVEIAAVLLVMAWFALQVVPHVGTLATPDAADGALAYLAFVGTFALGFAAGRLLIRRPLELEPPMTRSHGEPAHG
jgi:membrane associated rhomboid family serine protease